MKALVLTIGDEILIGQIVNTNAAWIGEQVSLLGIETVQMVTVGDDEAAIVQALADGFHQAECLIVTGGLGPTHDDITKVAVARYYGVGCSFDAAVYEQVKDRFRRFGTVMPESNRSQAMVPDGFEAMPNPAGTAPGLWHEDAPEGRRRIVVVLPGVPHEMKTIMSETVLPRLQARITDQVIQHRTLMTAGIGESRLQEEVGDLSAWLSPSRKLAYLPSLSGVRLRLSVYGPDGETVTAALAAFEAYLRHRIDRYIYGTDDLPLEAAVGQLLQARGLTLAVAESCTGGLVCSRLADISGSSAYLRGGIIAYDNAVKIAQLGVPPEVLAAHGAVSEAVVRQMARGVRDHLGADVAVAVTGILGPTGGTPEKPVGTVWIGYADDSGEQTMKMQSAGDRLRNKERASASVLNYLRLCLLNQNV
jgi:nicotinamide-nucleotide amidase